MACRERLPMFPVVHWMMRSGRSNAGGITAAKVEPVTDQVKVKGWSLGDGGTFASVRWMGFEDTIGPLVTTLDARWSIVMRRNSALSPQLKRLFELTELLLQDRPLDVVLSAVVDSAVGLADLEGAAVLLPEGGRLVISASTGRPFDGSELALITARSGHPVPVGTVGSPDRPIRCLSLATSRGSIGLLAVRGHVRSPVEQEGLEMLAGQAAIAIERSLLQEEARQADVLRRTDEMRRLVLATVAHDLGNPLAAIKFAASSLRDAGRSLSPDDASELLGLVETQADHMSRMIAGLLDHHRCESGTLVLHRKACSVAELVDGAVSQFAATCPPDRILADIPAGLPMVDADPVLVDQVLVNLVENADRYGPPGTPIRIEARPADRRVEISVADGGPGIAQDRRSAAFDMDRQGGTGGRAGLGLAIAKTFIEAHHERIWVDDDRLCGARLVFTLPTGV